MLGVWPFRSKLWLLWQPKLPTTKPTKRVPSEDSDQPGHPQFVLSIKGPVVLHGDSRDSDQIGHTCHFDGFVMQRLIWPCPGHARAQVSDHCLFG